MPDAAPFAYDCFLSHNSKDKPAVRALAKKLKDSNVRIWLDEEQMPPGASAQEQLEAGLLGSRTVAVLIGADGQGPWQDLEVKAALNLAVREKRPVIPVLLPTASSEPELPLFLHDRIWVDLRLTSLPDQEAAFERLRWGITGRRESEGQIDAAARIKSISNRLEDVEDRYPSGTFDALFGRLNRLERRGVAEADEALLAAVERFFDGGIDLPSLQSQISPQSQHTAPTFDFNTAAADWCDGRIALFLGQDLPSLFGGKIPPTRELPRALETELHQGYQGFSGTLAEVAELVELDERRSRADLRRAVSRLLAADAGAVALYDLIAEAPSPLLVLTSCYDTALEDRLRARPDRGFLLASPNARDGDAGDTKLDLEYWPPDPTRAASIDPDGLSAVHPLESGLSLVYRLRGRILSDNRDSLLITEGDYVQALRQAKRLLPDYVAAEVSARQLWFLGYDPRRWEDRLLVRLLLERRERSAPRAIAVQPGNDQFARAFWSANRVACVDGIEVPDFVAKLAKALP